MPPAPGPLRIPYGSEYFPFWPLSLSFFLFLLIVPCFINFFSTSSNDKFKKMSNQWPVVQHYHKAGGTWQTIMPWWYGLTVLQRCLCPQTTGSSLKEYNAPYSWLTILIPIFSSFIMNQRDWVTVAHVFSQMLMLPPWVSYSLQVHALYL